MIALKITDIKKMMQTLLHSTSFDQFSMQEISVTKDISLFMEGRLHPEYFSSEEIENYPQLTSREFSLWGEHRQLLAGFIKGDKAPLSFKFVLQAPDSYMQKLLASPEFTADPGLVKSLILTFRYENMTLTCLTGTAFRTFVPDKSLDALWDSAIRKSLDNMQIGFEEM
ncbi:MAG: hypothetical protein E7289_07445 [Lachnospiraceae bacterium]|nr:hypothetical protein [Lachnospiraceae bacterium]